MHYFYISFRVTQFTGRFAVLDHTLGLEPAELVVFNELNKMSFIDSHYLCVPHHFYHATCSPPSWMQKQKFLKDSRFLRIPWVSEVLEKLCCTSSSSHVVKHHKLPWWEILGAQWSDLSCDMSLRHLGFSSFGAKRASWFLWARGTSVFAFSYLKQCGTEEELGVKAISAVL